MMYPNSPVDVSKCNVVVLDYQFGIQWWEPQF